MASISIFGKEFDITDSANTFLGNAAKAFNKTERAQEAAQKDIEAEEARHKAEMNKIEGETAAARIQLEADQAQIQAETTQLEAKRTELETKQAQAAEDLKNAETEHNKNETALKAFQERKAQQEVEEQRKYEADLKKYNDEKPVPIKVEDFEKYTKDPSSIPESRQSEIKAAMEEHKSLNENLQTSQKNLGAAQKTFGDLETDRTSVEEKLKQQQQKAAEVDKKLEAINKRLVGEKDGHADKVKEFEGRGGRTPADKEKIAALSEHYEAIIDELPANKREGARDALANAMQAPNANKFMDSIRESKAFGDKAPQQLGKPSIDGVGDYNIRVRINPDTQQPEAVMSRSVARGKEDGSKANEEIIPLNKSGVLDLSRFAGGNVKLMAEGQFDEPIKLTGIERTNVTFHGPKTGGDPNSRTHTNGASPTKAFEVVGDEDGITNKRLQLAGHAADVEISRREVKSQLASVTAAFKAQGEVDSMTKQMEQMQKAMGQDVAAPSGIPGGGQSAGRTTA